MRNNYIAYLFLLLGLVSIVALNSCNTSKNNAATRNYQAFLTRYNIQYNGDKHYIETLEDMEKEYADDYDQLVVLHPSHARQSMEELPQPSGDFTRSIEKAQKALMLRSITKSPRGRARTAREREWKSRSEYNPYLHNSWLLMGKALFMQGDFRQASTVFFYISQHFKWLPSTVAEAKAWEARCYCALGEYFDAENILETIKTSNLKTKRQKEPYYLSMAAVALERSQWSEAVKYIDKAIECSSSNQKSRLNYLRAQLLARDGQNTKAYDAYKKISSNIFLSYDTRIKARVAMSEVTPPSIISQEINALRKLIPFESNSAYRNRIYFAIGNLLVQKGDTLQAIAAYEDAIKNITTASAFDGQIELSLGKLQYDIAKYVDAQPHYSQAVMLLPSSYPDIAKITYRSAVLDKYAEFNRNITLQDSLLTLAALGPEKCLEICERLAADYVKEQEEAERRAQDAEFLANAAANSQSAATQMRLPGSQQPGQAAKWYFYNPQLVENGKVQFQRIWGNRRLEDDWRRLNKNSFKSFDVEEEEDEDYLVVEDDETMPEDSVSEAQPAIAPSDDPAKAGYYYQNIPFSDEQKAQAYSIIADGLFNQGIILKNDIGNLSLAREKFNELLRRFPTTPLLLDAYNELYLINVRSGNKEAAEEYRLRIASEFPDTKLGKAMQHADYLERQRNLNSRADSVYAEVFDNYLNHNTNAVHKAVVEAISEYSGASAIPNLIFVDALAYAADRETPEFRERIKYLLMEYPETDMTAVAATMLENVDAGRNIQPTRRPFGSPRGSALLQEEILESTDMETAEIDSTLFSFNEKAPHSVVLYFPVDRVNPNELLYNVAKHNFTNFMSREFDLIPVNDSPYSTLEVKDFYNKGEALRYIELLLNNRDVEISPDVLLVPISSEDYQSLRRHNLPLSEYIRYAGIMKYDAAFNNILSEE